MKKIVSNSEPFPALALATRLVTGGRTHGAPGGTAVNPPVVRASTVLFDTVAAQRDMRQRRGTERLFTYGARGNPTAFALEDVVSELEGGYRTRLFPTGLAAAAMALTAYATPGDHILFADSVYEPVRKLANGYLARQGIESSFFPANGADLASHLRPNTRIVYVETPGSLAYEMCDLPAIAALTKSRGILLMADNTWGSGVLYRPIELGADVSIMAATKYLSGHSDVVLGSVCTTQEAWPRLNGHSDDFGMTVSPDDAYLVLRGTRTLDMRLRHHGASALRVAHWLAGRDDIARVLCPALPSDPGHALWQRDCRGTNGLVSFVMGDNTPGLAERVVDALALFGIGASWGGFESLATVSSIGGARTVDHWTGAENFIRLHIGLEDVGDLIADLGQALDRSLDSVPDQQRRSLNANLEEYRGTHR